MQPEQELIYRCLNNEEKAQDLLYKMYAPKMYGVCLRYAKNKMNADDILQDGFIKVFSSLSNYKAIGSFEGWIRRTMINTAINYLIKNRRNRDEVDIEHVKANEGVKEDAIDQLSLKELLYQIQSLPAGFRMVFNLYVIDGYSHKEIGEKLSISESTSKSQLARARYALQKKIKRNIKIVVYE